MKSNTYFVIFNPASCGGKTEKKWPEIKKALDDSPLSYEWKWTREKQHAILLVKEAVSRGYRKIISIGGDGTHNEVVNGILRQNVFNAKEIELGIIPGGTGNDYIRSHSIDNHILKGLKCILEGNTISIDVGAIVPKGESEVTRYFINSAGFGYDAYLMEKIESSGKQKGSSLVYMLYILKYLLKYNPIRLKLTHGDQEIEDVYYTVNVCLGKYKGGGLIIAPHAQIGGGKLAVSLIRKMSKLLIIANLNKFYSGTIDKMNQVSLLHLDEINISGTKEPPGVEADGEFLGKMDARISIIPGAINVYTNLKS